MIGSATIIAICLTLVCSLVLPILMWGWYCWKFKADKPVTALVLGAAGFFIMQMVIRVPILQILGKDTRFMEFAINHYVLYCLILAVTAALFEVIGRYVVAKAITSELTFETGVAAGLGHGGIEAIVLVGITYVNNLIYIVLINTGNFESTVESAVAAGADAASMYAIQDAFLTTSPTIFLLAGYERILTMILHVALSLLVCYFVKQKKGIAGVGICMLIHTIVDFVSPLINGMATNYMGNMISQTMAYVLVYVFLTIVAVISILLILQIKKKWRIA